MATNRGYSLSDLYDVNTRSGFLQWLRDNLPLINALPATQAEVNAGIINNKYVSPFTLAHSICCGGGGGLFDIDGGNASSIYPPPNAMDGGGA
jgi:hypothetical protein